MSSLPAYLGEYPTYDALQAAFAAAAVGAGARGTVAGRSVEDRPIARFDLGRPDGPVVLLTALIHGVELIGGVALLGLVGALARRPDLLGAARFVVLPVVNPDALAANTRRLLAGLPAGQRGNARGVDLNRNFPAQTRRAPLHPFSGSRYRLSPHYMGPHALSEPESQAVAAVAREVTPALSLAFHSFGEMLLFPYAFTRARHPRAAAYERLGAAMNAAMPARPFVVKPSADLYPVHGDLDDHLDAAYGTRAMTVEVSALDRRLAHPRRLMNPFSWMNPTRVAETVGALVPGLVALLEEALAPGQVERPVGTLPPRFPVELAAAK